MLQLARVALVVLLVGLTALACEKPVMAPEVPADPAETPATPAETPTATAPDPAAPADAQPEIAPDPMAPAEAMPTAETNPLEALEKGMTYTGTLGDKSFHMTLRREGQRLVGSYSLDDTKTEIPVAGALGEQMDFWFNESAEPEQITGTFEGKSLMSDPIEGTWTSADKSQTQPFKLSMEKK
ncbi:MAG: hypothetical protein RBU21_08555 [FCB group bacterium]|jgi:hypothetical protein|nr:hypothetical protein [FCB group bacterium]